MAGYWNKILEVDLTNGVLKDVAVSDEIYRDYMGGCGIGAWLLAQMIDKDTDPFSPDNPLIFMTGPLTGSVLPGCATRFDVISRSPQTGIFGESSCGGSLGVQLKRAGYDGIIITGASATPVSLRIDDGEAAIEDASDLWGLCSYDTADRLKEKIKGEAGKSPSVAAIGQAGENLVRFAAIVNDKGNLAGRTGLGAVMGSKKLKAVAVWGTKKVPFADAAMIDELRKELTGKIKESIAVQSMTAFGTNAAMDLVAMTGDLPIQNWKTGSWDDGVSKINGPTMSDTILTRNHSCYGCPVGCKRVVKVEDDKYAVPEGPGPEYETVAGFGTMLLIDNLNALARINWLCNRYGMDTITCGSTIAFLCECVENGLVSDEQMGGIKLHWGDADAAITLVEKTARREGIGNILAEGSAAAAKKIGGNAEDFITTVKGLESPMHDPRGFHGQALAYATSSRGACHVNAMEMFVEQGYVFYPDLGLGTPLDSQQSEGKGFMVVKTEDFGCIFNAACICHFPAIAFSEHDILNMLNAATGFNYTLEEMMRVGERMWVLKRALNNMFGVTRADDMLPKRMLMPVEDGPAAGSVPDMEVMLKEFYALRELDDQGRPSKKKLESLGLGYMVEKIY
ncbi:MAG: aldehyde ferredoxin oxidoreductase family protein [bacterium]